MANQGLAAETPRSDAWVAVHEKYNDGAYLEALALLKKIAATGDRFAPIEIAHIYELGGNGVAKDSRLAMEWYKRASAIGDTQADVALGRMYYLGEEGEPDYAAALECFRKADTAGSLYAIGLMHELGQGTEPDIDVASQFYRRAAKLGHLVARKNLGMIELRRGNVLRGLWECMAASARILWVAMKNADDSRLRVA